MLKEALRMSYISILMEAYTALLRKWGILYCLCRKGYCSLGLFLKVASVNQSTW